MIREAGFAAVVYSAVLAAAGAGRFLSRRRSPPRRLVQWQRKPARERKAVTPKDDDI